MNIEIMRTFVRLRQMLASNAQLARKLVDLENKYDAQLKVVFDAIRQLMAPPDRKKRKIGFLVEEKPPPTAGTSRRSFRCFENSQNVEVPPPCPFFIERLNFKLLIELQR